jgi:succinyl-CoA synthetase alpha subunit
MRAHSLQQLLKAGDRVAVSNITGREAIKVSVVSQGYCDNIVAGWALGKAGQTISVPNDRSIRVFGQFEDLVNNLPDEQKPNKIIVYSPPEAVYGDVKEVIQHGRRHVETIYVITEHVSVEVTAKLLWLCSIEDIDIVGCNTLGIINAHEKTRIGAVGGESPEENFVPGSVCIISNSGNMVNTIATYLQSAGLGISYGISTGKDPLILTPLKELLKLAQTDDRTEVIVLYVEPGGTYELEAIRWAEEQDFQKPILAYVSGSFADATEISLGHAGSVVDGPHTSATAKMAIFDNYFGQPVFEAGDKESASRLAETGRGIRVNTLHDLVPAATALNLSRDFAPTSPLVLKPWLVDMGELATQLPPNLVPHVGEVIAPYGSLIKKYIKSSLGKVPSRQSMRNASHASSNDGTTPRVYGYSLTNLMKSGSFVDAILLSWLGYTPHRSSEREMVEMCLIASLTNGPGTISAQGAKLSACAGNDPNTAMMTTLGTIGMVHGGNGKKAAKLIVSAFGDTDLFDPYDKEKCPDLDVLVRERIADFKHRKAAAKDAGMEYSKIPCLGHPVFNKERVNYDPRERVLHAYMEENGIYNVFLDFYHRMSREMLAQEATTKVHAVNVDAAIACVLMAICWPLLVNNKISVERAIDLPYMTFALGRVAGGASEYLDHRETSSAMDMRIPVSECRFLGRRQD